MNFCTIVDVAKLAGVTPTTDQGLLIIEDILVKNKK